MSANFRACLSVVLIFFCGALWASSASAKSTQAVHPNSKNSKKLQIPSGWQVFRGQNGLVVFHPQNWRVNEFPEGAFLAYRAGADGGAEALALVQPLTLDYPAQAVVQNVGQIMPQMFPGARVSDVRILSSQPDVAEARLDYTIEGAPYRGALLCFKQGNQGMLYAASALPDVWPEARDTAFKVLRSFLYASPGGATVSGAASTPPMIPWKDPIENAFSARVPKGWKVEGGLKRFHAVDVRPELVAASPDGSVLVRLGDAGIPPMAQANQNLTMTGFPEGSSYSPGYGLQMLVMRYLPGAQFATQLYLPQRVGQVSQVKVRNLPEIAQRAQAAHRLSGLNIRVDTGEVSFVAQNQQTPLNGYVFAQTFNVETPGMPGVGTWHVEILYGYMAKPDKEPLAQAALNAMVQSFQMDPSWLARQAQTTGQVSNIVTQTNQQITDIIHETFRNKQQSQDRAMDRYVRGAVRGTTLIEDPNTGEQFEVENGSNYYWRMGAGNTVAGTQTDTRPYAPNYWFERMNVLD